MRMRLLCMEIAHLRREELLMPPAMVVIRWVAGHSIWLRKIRNRHSNTSEFSSLSCNEACSCWLRGRVLHRIESSTLASRYSHLDLGTGLFSPQVFFDILDRKTAVTGCTLCVLLSEGMKLHTQPRSCRCLRVRAEICRTHGGKKTYSHMVWSSGGSPFWCSCWWCWR